MFAPFAVEKYRNDIVAQEIVCRSVIAQTPHSPAGFLFAAYPRDTLIWTVAYLNRSPWQRAEVPSNRYESASEWNKRGTRASGLY